MPDDGWDLAEEVTARQEMKDAVAANDDLLRGIPHPRFRPKTCVDGHHIVRRDPTGRRSYVCIDFFDTGCTYRKPFNVDGDQ